MLCGRTITDRRNTPACEYASVASSEAIFPPPYEYRGFVTSGTDNGDAGFAMQSCYLNP